MPTYAHIIFSSTSIKTGLDNVLFSVSRFITKKFPPGTIKYTMIDTKDKMKDFYKNLVSTGTDLTNKTQEVRKIPRPHAYVGYNFPNFNTEDSGLGISPLSVYPSQFFDATLKDRFPILNDKEREIEIRTGNVRIRVEAEVIFTCQSKEEQISLYTYLINFVKIYYGYRLHKIKTEYIMPASLIRSVKNIVFGEKTTIDSVGTELDKYLKDASLGGINPRYKHGKKEEKFYAMEYMYDIVDFQLSNKPEMDDGDKNNAVYNNFLIRFPIFVELYVPINYLLKVPELVSGIGNVSQIGDFVFKSAASDEDGNGQIMSIVKTRDTSSFSRGFIDPNNEKLIYSNDFLLSSPTDVVDIYDWLPESAKKLYDVCNIKERKEVFKICFFERDALLDEGYVTISDDFKATITSGSLTRGQTIEIYRNESLAKLYATKYKITI